MDLRQRWTKKPTDWAYQMCPPRSTSREIKLSDTFRLCSLPESVIFFLIIMACFSLSISVFLVLCRICVFSASESKSQRLAPLFALQDGRVPRKRCINLGSRREAAWPYDAEINLVKYRNPEPGLFSLPSLQDKGTPFNHAFATQRRSNVVSFAVKADARFTYEVKLGFAELDKRNCHPGARVMNLNVQDTTKYGVDVFKAIGCQKPYHATFENIKPGPHGSMSVLVRGINSTAQIATICVERFNHVALATCPAPRLRPVLKESECRQKDCFSFDGPGDYVVIGNSMSEREDSRNCRHRKTSSARLRIPPGAKVKKAILYWSASGRLTKNEALSVNGSLVATASLNGINVAANKTEFGGYTSHLRFYGAWADVTHVVRRNGLYRVGDVWVDKEDPYCFFNSAYAAWSLAVIYEQPKLPSALLNLCMNDFTFTYPEGVYKNSVQCIAGNHSTSMARTTVVTFESDAYKGEHFYINDDYQGDNVFRGRTAPNLDILTFDILSIVRTGVAYVSYTIESYFAQTIFGPATEGLFMPMRVVYHTLD